MGKKKTQGERAAESKEKASAVKAKRNVDLRKLADRGVTLCEGHTVKPGTLLRIVDIAEAITKGVPRMQILKTIEEKYGVCNEKAQKYYDAAIAYLVPADIEHHQQKMAVKLEAQYEELYRMAMEQGNIKTAREILDSLAKIYQLTGGNRVQIAENADGEKIINISFG